MLNNIRKLDSIRRKGNRRPDRSDESHDLPLDHFLTFSPNAGEQWNFKDDRHIYFNDVDLLELIGENRNDISLLCGVVQGLSEYQKFVWTRGGKMNAAFNATVTSLQTSAMARLSLMYEDLTGGVKFESDGSDYWVNGINVTAVLRVFMMKPSEKTRSYLESLKDKLALILERRHSSTRYDGVQKRTEELYRDISIALELSPKDVSSRLLSDGRSC